MNIYVDGSYTTKNPEVVGWGCVVEGGESFGGKLLGDISKSHQIGGELKAAMEAINFAVSKGCLSVTISHDYVGLQKWFSGEWTAKEPCSKEYVDFVIVMQKKIIINFKKIQSNTNPADEIARRYTGASSAH
jgi:ribonuclease H-related protein